MEKIKVYACFCEKHLLTLKILNPYGSWEGQKKSRKL
jgi:hypothetical protein